MSGPHRLTIISGGQTGVDRGALDAALIAGTPCGGWCPEDRKAEDGPIPDRYPLKELPGGGYAERTRKNVEDSDGTLIIAFGPITGGTARTIQFCRISPLVPSLRVTEPLYGDLPGDGARNPHRRRWGARGGGLLTKR